MRKTKQLLAGTLGSVLLVGADQSWASSVARQCAANALKRGAVVYLVDSPSETSVARNGMQDYLTASGSKADLTNFHTLSNYRRFATGDDLGQALATLGVFRHQPTVCVIDTALAEWAKATEDATLEAAVIPNNYREDVPSETGA